ncbi:MAG TPA: hypothetical protein VHL50_06430, partial [Pyrinomonadaceae bacterium]|nr:hypothetical protein [Pyrinomonadaceae bacterium]
MKLYGPHRPRGTFYRTSLLATAILTLAFMVAFAAQRSGSLDPTFSGDGKLIDGYQYGFDGVHQVVIQQDGKLVAAGHSSGYLGLARYNADGSLDTSFGGSGKVTTQVTAPIPAFNGANSISVAIQPDGKIVAAGGYNVGSPGDVFELVRLNPDGSLDTNFANRGITTTYAGYSYSLNLQTDGKIIVAGGNTIYRFNPNGSLDTSFGGGDGVATLTISIHSSVLQADGKIVSAGSVGVNPIIDFALVRCNPDGSLDTSFDRDGVVTTTIGEDDEANSVVIQSDGKIVAAGDTRNDANSYSDFALIRYNPDGSPDTSFDSDGIVTTRLGYTQARSVAIQPDGKILAAGYSNVARYMPDGSLDAAFDGDGVVAISNPFLSENAGAVLIQPDSKIIVAGTGGGIPTGGDFALARFNTSGSLDTAFGADGVATTDFGVFFNNTLNATAIQPDGKIVAAGNAVARYNNDGSPDTTFGGGTGKVGLSFSAYSVALQADGKIVVAGTHDNGDGFFSSDAWLTRLNPDGSLDTSFDGDGSVVIAEPEEQRYFNSVVIQQDGKIIAAGRYMFRFNANGSLDTNFDLDGNLSINAVAIQPDGKIVAAGSGSNGSNRDFALARYNPDGSPDTSFDGDGKVLTSILIDDYADSVAIQSDGKIVVSGDSHDGIGPGYLALVRYNVIGSLDPTFGSDGKVLRATGGYRNSIAIQANGRIVAAITSGPGADRGTD